MNNNEHVINLLALLDQRKSRTAINKDIKELEKTVRKFRLAGTFLKGETKGELNQIIRQMEQGLRQVRLQAKMDQRQLNREINASLKNVSSKEIQINLSSAGGRMEAQIRRFLSQAREYLEKSPLHVDVEVKKEKLEAQLESIIQGYPKIEGPRDWSGEAKRLQDTIKAASNKEELSQAADQLQVFRSGIRESENESSSFTGWIRDLVSNIAEIGDFFSLAFTAVEKFRESLHTLKGNDAIVTELSHISGMARQQLEELEEEAFRIAGKYGQLSSSYLANVRDLAQAGYGAVAKELGELSALAQSAGGMTAEGANNYILELDSAYGYAGNVKKLEEALDGAASISRKNGVAIREIADACAVSAASASAAGIALEELTAAEAAMIAATGGSGAEMGEAFEAVIRRIRQLSGVFDGEVIEAGQLKQAALACRFLGVELEAVKDGAAALKDPMEVLKELARAYEALPDHSAKKQGVLEALAGEGHGEALGGLLSQWNLYETMVREYSQGAGAAFTEANKSADSWAGRLIQLQNTWDSFVSSLAGKNEIKGGISFLRGMVQALEGLTDTMGALPILLTALNAPMAAINRNYGITQLRNPETHKLDIQGNFMGVDITAFKMQKKHFSEASTAINDWNVKLANGTADINDFSNAVSQNQEHFLAYLRTTTVTAPATLEGYIAYLNSAGVATDALRLKTVLMTSALSMGLGVLLQVTVSAISSAIGKEQEAVQAAQESAGAYAEAIQSIDNYTGRYKELREELLAARGSEEETYRIKKQLLELQTELNDKFGEEYGSLNLVTNAYRDQTDAIKAYGRELSDTLLNENEKGIRKAAKKMEEEQHYNLSYPDVSAYTDEGRALKEIAEKYKDQGIYLEDAMGNGENDRFSVHLKADPQSAYDTINQFETDLRRKAKELGDSHLFDDVLEMSSYSLNDAKGVIDQYGNTYKQSLVAQIAEDKDLSRGYQNAVDAVEAYNDAIMKSKNPYRDENVAIAYGNLQLAKQGVEGGEWEQYSGIMEEIFSSANDKAYTFFQTLQNDESVSKLAEELKGLSDIDLNAMYDDGDNGDLFDQLRERAKECEIEVQDLIQLLVELGYVQGSTPSMELGAVPRHSQFVSSISEVESLSQGLEQLGSIYANIRDQEEFDWSSILNNDGFESIFGAFTDEYDTFIETIANAPKDIDACQSAFDNLASAYLYQSEAMSSLTPETKQATVAMLEQMGIANANEVVESRLAAQSAGLASQKQIEALESRNLADASWQEVTAMMEAGSASGIAAGYLAQFALEKRDITNNPIDSKADIDHIIAIARAAGTSKEYIHALRIALINLQTAQVGVAAAKSSKTPGASKAVKVIAAESNKQQKEKEVNDIWNGIVQENKAKQPNPEDFYVTAEYGSHTTEKPKGGNNYGGSSAPSASPQVRQTKETFNFIEIAINRMQEAFTKLKAKAEETFQSFTSRGKSYQEALTKTTEEISLQQTAYDEYMKKANSYGLGEDWASKVRDGSIEIADVTDDSLKEKIKGYQEWYNKAQDCQDKIQELQKTQRELTQDKIELLVTKYDKLLSKLKSVQEKRKDYIDYKEEWGGTANKKDYQKLSGNAKSQIQYYIKQNKELMNLQNTVEKGSQAWYEYQEKVDSNNASIRDLTKSMAEYANDAAVSAAKKAEKANKQEDAQDERLDKKLSTASSASRKNTILRRKLTNIGDRQKHHKDAYTTTQKDRAYYGSKIQKASQKGVSKQQKQLFTDAINAVKGGKMISAAIINKIVEAMKTAEGNGYQSLSRLLSYCNYYNANKLAEQENRLNYEMYTLTAQKEKAALRKDQLENRLDANQAKADKSMTSLTETTAAKNRELDLQTRLSHKNVSAHTTAVKEAVSDRKTAAGAANISSNKTYKKVKDKKLKKRISEVISAIKSGKKISNDGLKAVKEFCKKYLKGNLTYYYNCAAYNEAVENELSAKEAETLAKAEAYAQENQAKLEKADNTVSGRDKLNERYAATGRNKTSAAEKNKYVDKQAANIDKNLNIYKNNYDTFSTRYDKAKNKVDKFSHQDKPKQKIVDQVKTKYTSKNKMIPASVIEKAFTVSESFGLACKKYNEALEAKKVSKETYDLYAQTAKEEKAALSLEKMSNIETEYANKQRSHQQKANQINSAIDLVQTKGYEAGEAFYNKLIQEEESVNSSLTAERKSLTDSLKKSLSDGSIKRYSDEWYEACDKIDSVTNAINESSKSLEEFKNQARQVKWDNFDYLQERIQNVASELNFMLEELSREDLVSDETGKLTKQGEGAAYLHAAGYHIYEGQAKDYKKELEEIDRDISKDPYNKTLLERREALVLAYQEASKAAQDEKCAVIELYQQGYEALSNKIKNLVSEYGELLDAEKEAYDYQNTISDKTGEIARIRKQLTAYAGDISEETKAKVQMLQVSLEEAEKDLAKTQYDRYISDTKEMMSQMQESMDEAIQELVDAMSKNFQQLLTGISENVGSASAVVVAAMKDIGYTSTEEFNTLLNGTSLAGSVTSMVTELKNLQAGITANAEKLAAAIAGDTAEDIVEDPPKPAKEPKKTSAIEQNVVEKMREQEKVGMESGRTELGKPLIGIDQALPSIMSYLNYHLNSTTAKREKLSDMNKKFYDSFGKKVLSDKDAKGLANLLGIKYDNQKSSGKLYKKLKALGIKGFKTGSRSIPNDQLAFLGEGGNELQFDKSEGVLRPVGKGDMVFTAEQARALWDLTQGRAGLSIAGQYQPNTLRNAPEIHNVSQDTNVGDVTINLGGLSLPGVKNYDEFRDKLIKDKMFEKAMGGALIGPLGSGFNSLDKYKYLSR